MAEPVVTTRWWWIRHAPVDNPEEVDRLDTLRSTLRQHYRNKRRHYGVDYPNFYDRDLRRLFSGAPEHTIDAGGTATTSGETRHVTVMRETEDAQATGRTRGAARAARRHNHRRKL